VCQCHTDCHLASRAHSSYETARLHWRARIRRLEHSSHQAADHSHNWSCGLHTSAAGRHLLPSAGGTCLLLGFLELADTFLHIVYLASHTVVGPQVRAETALLVVLASIVMVKFAVQAGQFELAGVD